MNEENVKKEVVTESDKTQDNKKKDVKSDKRNNTRRPRRNNNFSRQKVI